MNPNHGHFLTTFSSRGHSPSVSSTPIHAVTSKADPETPIRPGQAWPDLLASFPGSSASFQYSSPRVHSFSPANSLISSGKSNCRCSTQFNTSAPCGGESTILYAEYGCTCRSGFNAESSANQVSCTLFEKQRLVRKPAFTIYDFPSGPATQRTSKSTSFF